MGTSLAAFQAGSINYVLIAAVEGYPNLLCEGSTAAAVAAYSIAPAEYTAAIGGLYVDLNNEQRITPWEAFQSGGTCNLTIVPTPGQDTFGVDTHKRSAGFETVLSATIDHDDTTINVLSTAAFPASGTIYIGTEAITYSGVTATSFTGCTRGKYSPVARASNGKMSHYHRVGTTDLGPVLQPVVSSQPRVWIGRRVAVRAHRVLDGVLDIKSESLLVFVGRIVEIRDDPSSMGTAVSIKHEMDYVKEAVVGMDLWTAKLASGIYIQADVNSGDGTFNLFEYHAGFNDTKEANPLTVVVSGAAGTNQMNQGTYTPDQLYGIINQWLVAELAAARIRGTYVFRQGTVPPDGKIKQKIEWDFPAYAGTVKQFVHIGMPEPVLAGFGWTVDFAGTIGSATGAWIATDAWDGVTVTEVADNYLPLNSSPFSHTSVVEASVIEEHGTFVDQWAYLPNNCPNTDTGHALEWGVFLLDNKYIIYGTRAGATLANLRGTSFQFGGATPIALYNFQLEEGQTSVDIRQILVLQDTMANLLTKFLYSTGTTGYNHASLDVLGYGLGLGVPSELMTGMVASVAALPGATAPLVMTIDKPIKFVDLLAGDLVFRRAFLRWVDGGGFEMKTWQAPAASLSVYALTESNKAAASGQDENHRAATMETAEFQKSVIKVQYDRTITDSGNSDGYTKSITFIDGVAVDDAGGAAKTLTLKARNTYGEFASTGQAVEDLMPDFLANLPLFSRPMRMMTRSMSSKEFESFSVGDIVTVTDTFARDPATGTRGISARSAIVTRMRWNPGGRRPGSDEPTKASGELDLFFLDLNRISPYAPSARVDDTATNGGYVVATKTLTCYAHSYSESSEAADASNFPATHKVRVIEIDPPVSASPVVWDDTVVSQTGNTIVLTTGLSAPAWDSTKKYRVVYQSYGSVLAAQQTKAFEADETDGLISNVAQPFMYSTGNAPTSWTAASGSDPVELPPTSSDATSKPRDTGHDFANARLLNNLVDFKTARSSPMLHSLTNSFETIATWKLVHISQMFLCREFLTTGVTRALHVAPWFRSFDGNSASIRVTISTSPPTGNTVIDVNRGTVYSEVTFTTSSTTWATPAAQSMDLRARKNSSGLVWIYIERSGAAETRGLAECYEGPRTT